MKTARGLSTVMLTGGDSTFSGEGLCVEEKNALKPIAERAVYILITDEQATLGQVM